MVEGSLELQLDNVPGKTLTLEAGEMAAFKTDIKVLPKKFVIDLKRLVTTSNLLEGSMGPLPHTPIIIREIELQNKKKRTGRLLDVRSVRDPDDLPPRPGDDINDTRRLNPPIDLPDRPPRGAVDQP